MCALTQPEARNELVVLGKQLLSARCPHFLGLSCPLPGRCGTRDLQRRGSPRCMFSLRSFAVLPDGSFQEATQRENLRGLWRTGVDVARLPPHPTPPHPRQAGLSTLPSTPCTCVLGQLPPRVLQQPLAFVTGFWRPSFCLSWEDFIYCLNTLFGCSVPPSCGMQEKRLLVCSGALAPGTKFLSLEGTRVPWGQQDALKRG